MKEQYETNKYYLKAIANLAKHFNVSREEAEMLIINGLSRTNDIRSERKKKEKAKGSPANIDINNKTDESNKSVYNKKYLIKSISLNASGLSAVKFSLNKNVGKNTKDLHLTFNVSNLGDDSIGKIADLCDEIVKEILG